MPPIPDPYRQDDEEDLESLLGGKEEEPAAEEPPPDDPDTIEVSLDDDKEGLPPESRTARRRERGKLFSALQESERKRAELEARLARLEGVAQVVTSQVPQQQQQDQLELLHTEYTRQRDRIHGEYNALREAGKLTAEKERELQKELDRLDLHRTRALTQIAASQQQPQVDPQEVTRRTIQAQLAAQYPDVYRDERAVRYAGAIYQQLAAKFTGPDGSYTVSPLKLHEMAMKQTRKDLGIKSDGPDTPRHKFHGSARGGRGGGGERRSVRMGAPQQGMADELYSNVEDPKERYRLWAKRVGSKVGR